MEDKVVQQRCANCIHGLYYTPPTKTTTITTENTGSTTVTTTTTVSSGGIACNVDLPQWASGNPKVTDDYGYACKLFVRRD